MNTEMFLFYNKCGFILAIKGRLSLVVNKTKDFHFELKRVNFYPVSLSVTLK